jgi:oligopeptide/dipeptide ABC transporter ATP-binding protein
VSADPVAVAATTPALAQARFARGAWRTLWREKAALAGAVFLFLLLVAALLGPVLYSNSSTVIDLLGRFGHPSWAHPLGTDGLGRDVLARLLAGARVTLLIGVCVVITSATIGTLLGMIAGYKGGRLDSLIMRAADAQLAFPGLLLVLLVLAFVGTGIPILIAVLVIYGWMIYARLVRGQVLQLRQTPAVQAAELVGCSTPRIIFRHLLPNLYSIIITQGLVEFARVCLAEASLSYLGFGVQPPNSSWGLMVAENQGDLRIAWWATVFPGLALALTVLAANLVSNWLRVETDPQQRQRRFHVAAGRGKGRKAAGFVAVTDRPAAAADADPLLEVERLHVVFHTLDGPVTAVQNFSLSIAPGETLGIVGESGSGKSTAALALLDLVPPPGRIERAEVRWRGKQIGARELHRLRGSEITMIFQDPMTSLNPLVPVGRQVAEVLIKHKGMSRREARERTVELFTLVGIPSPRQRLKQYPYQLSGGLRQRVMIATALAPEPKLLVADEPTTALDATIQAQILELIAELQERLQIAVLLITHDLGVVAQICDRVVVMYGGHVLEEAPTDELFADPRQRYTEALLAAAPTIEQIEHRLATIPGRPPSRYEELPGCPFVPRCGFATAECDVMPALTNGGPRRFACWHPVDAGRR